jgi:hypothetical protein
MHNQVTSQKYVRLVFKHQFIPLVEPEEIAKKANIPGPGMYKLVGIDSVGKYTLSTVP